MKKPDIYSGILQNNRHHKIWRLFLTAICLVVLWLLPRFSNAHQSPNTLIFLDVNPAKVSMEVHLPLPELALAFGNDISREPETLIERLGAQLKEYLKAHIKAYTDKNKPWRVDIVSLKMDKGIYPENGLPYWEVIAYAALNPDEGESTRSFYLAYDAVMHQVINHMAFVSIRSDWENGKFEEAEAPPVENAAVIARDNRDNLIHPLEVNLQKGSWWAGFKEMFSLGMHHIKEGTDHLLFLLVLLLPAMLVVDHKKWGSFGGIKYSLVHLLKIITAFTIGHSVTLLIGALGWVRLPAQPVEIMIAFSILVSAIHAVSPVFPGKESYVAAGFGLVHGLAFAGILTNLHLSSATLALSILGFNLGIECMQLFIIALIVPSLMLLSKTAYYKWFRIAGALLAAVAALAWMAERSSGKANFVTSFTSTISQQGIWYIVAIALLSIVFYILHLLNNRKAAFSQPGEI
ncbi:MAG: HupE/UreJ family protein [Agriterribacter sp.]